jgi:hypothetical protein
MTEAFSRAGGGGPRARMSLRQMNLGVVPNDGSRAEPSTATVPIEALHPADSPRLAGENQDHVRTLAELQDKTPPITVHRRTMRVVDGMHRLRAASLRGQETIEVHFIDGPEDELFVMAVQANVTHGLPLTTSDRKAAAQRIIGTNPTWSDRRIAAVVGLSGKTVGALRRATADTPQSHSRLGRDGRLRPVCAAEGRIRAGELLAANPAASLREISAEAGVSTGTVRDVRTRLAQGRPPIPVPRHANPRTAPDTGNPTQLLDTLRADPSLRLTESGRVLLRILEICVLDPKVRRRLLSTIPEHCRPAVARLAAEGAALWRDFADQLTPPDHR